MNRYQRRLTLLKGREHFVFNYAEGRESDLLDALISLASKPESSFDWLDAAALCLQLGRQAKSVAEPIARGAVGPRL